MKKKLKVLIITSGYPSKSNPSRRIFVKEQAEALNSYVDVSILNLEMNIKKYIKNKHFLYRSQVYEENDILTFQFKRFNFGRLMPCLHAKLYEKQIKDNFKKVLKKIEKPDLIHAHFSYPAGYGAMVLSKEYDIPFVVTEHATFFEDKLMDKYKKYTEQVLNNADAYTAVSSFLKNKILKTVRNQCEIIPNFIKQEKFNRDLDKSSWNYGKQFNLLNVSSMVDKKGVHYLLRSINQLVFKYKKDNIHLHLIGDGPKKREYQKLAKKLNIAEYCTFYGMVNNEEVAKYMNLCDAVVISSKIETFGVVGIEAMASGCPVLSTKCNGPEDYINSDNGILVKNEDMNALTNGIIKLINNYDEFNSKKIKNYIKAKYSKEAVCKQILSLYKRILK